MTDPFDLAFDSFRFSAFRYEGQPSYAVSGEAEALRAWREHRPRPERSLRTSDWLRRMAATQLEGKEWSRARVVDHPVSEYLMFAATTGYLENQAMGERIVMVDRGAAPSCTPDFWLLDGGTVHAAAMVMHYSEDGEFLDFTPVQDKARLREFEKVRQSLLRIGQPLNEWLAEQERARA